MGVRKISSTMQDSVLLDLPTPLAIVCHDAGAANIIFAWMRELACAGKIAPGQWRLFLEGPAATLWKQVPLDISCCDTLTDALSGAGALLSGTGWASTLEHDARCLARERGIFSSAVIDHWVNYRERFVRNGETVLPDEIVVTDEYALSIAQRSFAGLAVRQRPNAYLRQIVESIPPLTPDIKDILYALEPIRDSWGRAQGGEFQALTYFLENLDKLDLQGGEVVRLRPHPSESPEKYLSSLGRVGQVNVEMSTAASLGEAIGQARWVVGAETFAMVVGLGAGRRVMSTLPPWAHRCRLPHAEILSLRDMVG